MADEVKPTTAADVASTEQPKADSATLDQVVKEAVKQITFYLSDSNLPYDKFLFTAAQKTLTDASKPLGTGWVPIATIMSFKRMQQIMSQSSLASGDCEKAIVEGLRTTYPDDDTEALIEVNQAGDELRRRRELVPPHETNQMDRSIYAKGFPDEEAKKGGDKEQSNGYQASKLQQDLEKFFTDLGVGTVNAVRMRRDDDKKFKNSVFVEFDTVDAARSLADQDPKPTYPGQSEPLLLMLKKAYIDMKAKEKGVDPKYKNESRSSGRPRPGEKPRPFNAWRDWRGGADSHQNGHDRRPGRDSRSENKRDGAKKEPKALEVKVHVEGKEMDVDTETGMLKNPEELEYTRGKIARFEGASTGDSSNPMDLKWALQPIAAPAFVEYEKGSASGVVFFKEALGDKFETISKAGLTLGTDDDQLRWTLLADEEEKEFHLKRAHKRAGIALATAQASAPSNDRRDRSDRDSRDHYDGRDNRGRGRGRGRGFRGGERGGRGRGRGGSRGGHRSDERRPDDRNAEKRKREDDDDKPRGSRIGVPTEATAAPEAKKAKTEG